MWCFGNARVERRNGDRLETVNDEQHWK